MTTCVADHNDVCVCVVADDPGGGQWRGQDVVAGTV